MGQKVVCVDDGGYDLIKNGQHYTIEKGNYSDSNGGPYVVLVGICDEPHRGFYASRFRPLVEKKTDISVFTALLNPTKQTTDA